MGLPGEVVLMLINHMIATRGVHFAFRTADKLACTMKDVKILSAEDADAFFRRNARVREGCRKVLRSMGKRREASDA